MKYFGPSTLVSAAFIGPGTITVCTIAGVNDGYDLLFALVFSTIATIVLQEMSARVGLVTQSGLGKQVRKSRKSGGMGLLLFILVSTTILIGNTAYEAGNISGAALGIDLVFGKFSFTPLVFGILSFVLLFLGKYKQIEAVLIGLVLLISLAFLATLVMLKPNLLAILSGLFPQWNKGYDWLRVMALIGTTVVPYNLFLHASLIANKYKKTNNLGELRKELGVSIGLGGLVSMMILIVAASSKGLMKVQSGVDLAAQLQPLLGTWANFGIGLGLFAAGLSSAITAPLAAALVAKELFNWPKDNKGWKYRMVWMTVLGVGVLFSSLGYKPIVVIQFAQLLNGVMLPIVAIYLLLLVNKKDVLGSFVNSRWQNLISIIIVLVTILLSLKTLLSLFSF